MAGGVFSFHVGAFPPFIIPKQIDPAFKPISLTPHKDRPDFVPSQDGSKKSHLMVKDSKIAKLFYASLGVNPNRLVEGNLCFSITLKEKSSLLSKLKHIIVVKFSHNRPRYADFCSFFKKLNFVGVYKISEYDRKHIFVEFSLFEDFSKFWMLQSCVINGFKARLFQWRGDFNPNFESNVCPVWVHLPCLPLYLFNEDTALTLAALFGKPLFVDPSCLSLQKVGVLSFCVAMEVTTKGPDVLWIETVEDGVKVESFKQQVAYGTIPEFCVGCRHLGHHVEVCKVCPVSSSQDQDFNTLKVFDRDGMATVPTSKVFERSAAVELTETILADLSGSSSVPLSSVHTSTKCSKDCQSKTVGGKIVLSNQFDALGVVDGVSTTAAPDAKSVHRSGALSDGEMIGSVTDAVVYIQQAKAMEKREAVQQIAGDDLEVQNPFDVLLNMQPYKFNKQNNEDTALNVRRYGSKAQQNNEDTALNVLQHFVIDCVTGEKSIMERVSGNKNTTEDDVVGKGAHGQAQHSQDTPSSSLTSCSYDISQEQVLSKGAGTGFFMPKVAALSGKVTAVKDVDLGLVGNNPNILNIEDDAVGFIQEAQAREWINVDEGDLILEELFRSIVSNSTDSVCKGKKEEPWIIKARKKSKQAKAKRDKELKKSQKEFSQGRCKLPTQAFCGLDSNNSKDSAFWRNWRLSNRAQDSIEEIQSFDNDYGTSYANGWERYAYQSAHLFDSPPNSPPKATRKDKSLDYLNLRSDKSKFMYDPP